MPNWLKLNLDNIISYRVHRTQYSTNRPTPIQRQYFRNAVSTQGPQQQYHHRLHVFI
jgi:hypothetical protein